MLATILHDPCASPLPGRGGGKGMEKAGGNRAQELSSNSDPNRPKYANRCARWPPVAINVTWYGGSLRGYETGTSWNCGHARARTSSRDLELTTSFAREEVDALARRGRRLAPAGFGSYGARWQSRTTDRKPADVARASEPTKCRFERLRASAVLTTRTAATQVVRHLPCYRLSASSGQGDGWSRSASGRRRLRRRM